MTDQTYQPKPGAVVKAVHCQSRRRGAYCLLCRVQGSANHDSSARHRKALQPKVAKDNRLSPALAEQFYAMRHPEAAEEAHFERVYQAQLADEFMAWFLAEANSRPDDGLGEAVA